MRRIGYAANKGDLKMAIEADTEPTELEEGEIILRKKKQPELKTGVTAQAVLKTAAAALETLREKKPLVACMTNIVSANFQANALLALGASPAMVEDIGEASQITSVADALLINVGTVTKPQTDAMRAAVSHANMNGRPWTLDPVGVGALPLRTFTAKELMRRFPAFIRGNASEIDFLVSGTTYGRGMDASVSSDQVAQSALRLAGVTRAAVLVTGETDYVALEGAPLVAIANGSPLMTRVTGVGCVQGAIGSAFLGALGAQARWESALASALVVAIAGEIAVEKGKTLGAFPAAFIDALDSLKPSDITKRGKVKLM